MRENLFTLLRWFPIHYPTIDTIFSNQQISTSPTTSTLFITECFMHDSGLITCKITNKFGSTSSKAALDVQVEREPENPPKWISRPRYDMCMTCV